MKSSKACKVCGNLPGRYGLTKGMCRAHYQAYMAEARRRSKAGAKLARDNAPEYDRPDTVPGLWVLRPVPLVPQLVAELEARWDGGDRAAARQLELLGRAA